MKYIYFDASAGLSGDMILGALLDLGVSSSLFREKMAELKLPVEIQLKETKRGYYS
ncbi:Pyridinium-3,5-bisthiocarboxylic acid mononucleotide nickel insertion protein [subsurface metagenome]